jgi:hypothetical protein
MIKSAGVEENEDGSRSYQFFSREIFYDATSANPAALIAMELVRTIA